MANAANSPIKVDGAFPNGGGLDGMNLPYHAIREDSADGDDGNLQPSEAIPAFASNQNNMEPQPVESAPVDCCNACCVSIRSWNGMVYHGITIALVFITCLVGVLIPKVEVVLAYKGALFGTVIVYLAPAIALVLLESAHASHWRWSDSMQIKMDAESPSLGSLDPATPKMDAMSTISNGVELEGVANDDDPNAGHQVRPNVGEEENCMSSLSASWCIALVFVPWGLVVMVLGVTATAMGGHF